MSDRSQAVIKLRSMKERRYGRISVDDIVVINSRERDQKQFDDNARSIESVGLLKPIVVNEHYFEKSGKYELVCGEGRLNAHKRLKKLEIDAEIVDVDRKQALLMSLIENMARVPPGTMWFAKEVVRMKNAGMPLKEIALILGRSDSFVSTYINLAERGEDRLIRGVEQGVFPMTFAYRVAEAGDADIQNILMDAFDANVVTSANFTQIKRIINMRASHRPNRQDAGGHKHMTYTVDQLKRDISRVTKEKQSYVKEAEHKENRLFTIVGALEKLMKTSEFVELTKAEGLQELPQLTGAYGGLTTTARTAMITPEDTNGKITGT